MRILFALIATSLLLPTSALAEPLQLCVKADRFVEGKPREGTKIVLRSQCKVRSNGTLIEISLGTTDALGSIGSEVPNEHLVWDSKWLPGPKRTALNLDIGTTEYDFVFGMVRAGGQTAGQLLLPNMSASSRTAAPAYVGLNGSTLKAYAHDYYAVLNDLGDISSMLISQAEVRYRAFKRTPDFDSEWVACTSSQTYTYTHNIGALPEFALVEVAENSDGSGWRVPTMSASNYSSDWWHQTAIVRMTDTTVALRTGSRLVRFHDETGADIWATTGYCRVRLFEWTPDYDSGWTATSITAGDRDKWFKHGLGQEPSLVMLWVAENADGSGWLLPAMNSYHYDYTRGVGIYRVTDQWAVIKGSASAVAQFRDSNGMPQSPTSGYVRFMAWK